MAKEFRRDPTDFVQLKIRIREALRARLEEEASQRRSSINSEVVERIEHTFQRADLLADVLSLAFGERLGGLLILIGHAMSNTALVAPREHKGEAGYRPLSDESWVSDPLAYDAAMFAATVLLDCAAPAPAKHREKDKEKGRYYAFQLVTGLLNALNGRDVDMNLGRGSHTGPVRRLIGPTAASKMKERLKESARLLVDSTPVTDGARRRA
jgi:hypothetical protein